MRISLRHILHKINISRWGCFVAILLLLQPLLTEINAQDQKLTIQANNKPVREVIGLIENKTQLVFFYNDKDVDLERKVSINVKNQSVVVVLEELFKNTPNVYKIQGRQVFITRKPPKADDQPKQKDVKMKITGIVVDETNQSVIGANVMVDGTTVGTITDLKDVFNRSSRERKLRISYIGYETAFVNIEKKTSHRIILEPSLKTLEEVVVVGYGTQKKKR